MTLEPLWKMNNRSEIFAADLYVLLQRELRRRQSPECVSCYMQVPFRVDRHEAEAPNWEVVLPPSCPQNCRSVIEDLIAEFGLLYELLPDGRG